MLVFLASALSCGGDVVLTLGQPEPAPVFGDLGRPVASINGSADEENPTLTADLLEIYFASNRAGGPGSGDVWCAKRNSRADAFGGPSLVGTVSTPQAETSPAISPDGLTLWVGSDRPGGVGDADIWQFERASRDALWGPGVNVSALNTPRADLPRPVAEGGLVMPFASRDEAGLFQTYLARRVDAAAEFDEVVPLEAVRVEGSSTSDAFLTEDGLFLFFSRTLDAQGGQLFMTWRTDRREPFRQPIPLTDVDTSDDERDPWLDPESTRFFFSSSRRVERRHDIYATTFDVSRFK